LLKNSKPGFLAFNYYGGHTMRSYPEKTACILSLKR
jgi:hypothetical protein